MTAHPPAPGPRSGFAYIASKKWSFLALTFVVFGATVFTLALFDLLPNGPSGQTPELTDSQRALDRTGAQVLPETIAIPKLNLTAKVANPTTKDPETLDNDLLYGAVRYPGSGYLGRDGENVVVFGHSSYLPVVHNQAFKTFDGIQTLVQGDRILVTGANQTYVYEVETVASASASSDAIPLTVTGNKLTLVTCDSFKTKSDRFVVIAHLVERYPTTN